MSYVTRSETGGDEVVACGGASVRIRKLTESQGARSELYDVYQATDKVTHQRAGSTTRARSKTMRADSSAALAIEEHVQRHLRACREKAEALAEADNPIDLALRASNLRTLLQELWQYRSTQSMDWTEMLNLLQLVLSKEEFEELSVEKRRALSRIFAEGWLARTVGRGDMERLISLLSSSGFDIWTGIREADPV